MGVLQVRPMNSRVLPNPRPLTVRTLGLSRLRSALAIHFVPAESFQKRRACRAPILPEQVEDPHVAVERSALTAL
eukprot:14589919-Alexandrium_andersonii.AAC.1